MSNRPCRLAGLAGAGAAVAILTGCGAGSGHHDSDDARSPRAVATEFLQALEHHDGDGMRHLMTPMAQRNEEIPGGVLSSMPPLTSFQFSHRVAHESPRTNGSPRGSIASLRFTVAMTPSAGFSDDDTSGSSYGILLSETPDERWLVAELGGGG